MPSRACSRVRFPDLTQHSTAACCSNFIWSRGPEHGGRNLQPSAGQTEHARCHVSRRTRRRRCGLPAPAASLSSLLLSLSPSTPLPPAAVGPAAAVVAGFFDGNQTKDHSSRSTSTVLHQGGRRLSLLDIVPQPRSTQSCVTICADVKVRFQKKLPQCTVESIR